jgi:hypothetical protein
MTRYKKKPVTAQELMTRLQSDPNWVAQLAKEQAARGLAALELQKSERLLVADLCSTGMSVRSVCDLVRWR